MFYLVINNTFFFFSDDHKVDKNWAVTSCVNHMHCCLDKSKLWNKEIYSTLLKLPLHVFLCIYACNIIVFLFFRLSVIFL